MLLSDKNKEKLFYGLCEHFKNAPKWIVYRTVELAKTPGHAFDAMYDYNEKDLPVAWDFLNQKWKKQKIVIE